MIKEYKLTQPKSDVLLAMNKGGYFLIREKGLFSNYYILTPSGTLEGVRVDKHIFKFLQDTKLIEQIIDTSIRETYRLSLKGKKIADMHTRSLNTGGVGLKSVKVDA